MVLYQKFHFSDSTHQSRHSILQSTLRAEKLIRNLSNDTPLSRSSGIEIWNEKDTASKLAGEDIKPGTLKCNVLIEGTYHTARFRIGVARIFISDTYLTLTFLGFAFLLAFTVGRR